jgi:AbrB family looped-hinge helix DNA binding protein
MRSTVTKRGQTVIPAAVRHQFHITPSDRLEWIVENNTIRVVPVKKDPISAFRGKGRGGATTRLLKERAADRERE